MASLPSQVRNFLIRLATYNRPLTYLRVDRQGRLLEWGGQLESFSLPPLEKGTRIGEQIYFLEGLLPSKEKIFSLSNVEVDSHLFIDIHVFQGRTSDWILLLAASEGAYERRSLLRKIQRLTQDLDPGQL